MVKWNDKFDNLNWPKIYHVCHKTSVDTKLRWFQYRLLYRILPTNRFLYLRRLKDTENCRLCLTDVETIEHMLYECRIVSTFWQNVNKDFIQKLPHVRRFDLSKELILFGVKDGFVTDKPLKFLLLCAKFYIYSLRFTDGIPNANVFLRSFKYRYKIEKYYHENIRNSQFDLIWHPYQQVLNNL